MPPKKTTPAKRKISKKPQTNLESYMEKADKEFKKISGQAMKIANRVKKEYNATSPKTKKQIKKGLMIAGATVVGLSMLKKMTGKK